jgi:hypothetical protein
LSTHQHERGSTPMGAPSSLAVLELETKNSELVSNTIRYYPNSPNSHLVVTWKARKCPRGFKSVARGVVFARNLEDYIKDSYQADINKQSNKYFWTEPPVPNGAMLVVILPQGYIIPTAEEVNPTFLEAKTFKNKMVLIWIVREKNDIEFSWSMKQVQYITEEELKDHCARLNKESSEKRKKEKKINVSNSISIKNRNSVSIPIAICLGILAPISGIFGNLAASNISNIPHFLNPVMQFSWVIFLSLMVIWIILAIWQPFTN